MPPSHAETQILQQLDAHNGNVDLVAKEIGVSSSWISRIKKSHNWQPKDDALIVPPPASIKPTDDNEVVPYLAPDIERVTALRTSVLDKLTDSVEDLRPRDAVKLLEVLLMYENSMRATMTPNLSIYNDHRKQTVHVNQLADALRDRLDIDQLRAAAGVPAPLDIEIIEMEIENA